MSDNTQSQNDCNDEYVHTRGLTVALASAFVVGGTAGLGILALPNTIEYMGWIGLVIILFFALVCGLTGIWLSKTWSVIQARDLSLRGHVPNPYPIIGEKAFGKAGRTLVALSMNFTSLGTTVVYLLIVSENLQDIFQYLLQYISFCYWLIIVACVICPLTWLGSPKDFGFIAIVAATSGIFACILLVIQMLQEPRSDETVIHNELDVRSFSLSFGTIAFALCGHTCFPTIQNDMKKPANMKWAIFIGFSVITLLFIVVSGIGYFRFGQETKENVLLNLSDGTMTHIIQWLFIFHIISSFILNFNPLLQELEGRCNIPNVFSARRCIFRTSMMAVVLFIAESIPRFSAIMSLVGGSSITLICFVFPPVFYLKICTSDPDMTESAVFVKESLEVQHYIELRSTHERILVVPLWEKVLIGEIIIVGIGTGIAATVAAVYTITSPDVFTLPCYVNLTDG